MNTYVVGDIHAGYRESKRYSHKDKLMNFNEEGIVITLGTSVILGLEVNFTKN